MAKVMTDEQKAKRALDRKIEAHKATEACLKHAETWSQMCDNCLGDARVYSILCPGGPHPEVTAWKRLYFAKETLRRNIAFAQESLNKWAADFAKDPSHAFEWSAAKFEEAARVEVYTRLLAIIEEQGLDKAATCAMDEALRGARWPSHSTSAPSNLMAECRTAVYADWGAGFTGR